jgi:hypothetical protein
VDKLYKKLAENTGYLSTARTQQSRERAAAADETLSVVIERVLFYNLSLMDSMAKSFEVSESERLVLAQGLFQFVEASDWLHSPTLAMRTLADDELIMSAANALATVRLITRLCFFCSQTRRFGFSKTSAKELVVKQNAFDLLKVNYMTIKTEFVSF